MVDFEHRLTWGQSLAIGSQGTPRISAVSEVTNGVAVIASGGTTPLQVSGGTGLQRPDLSMGYRISQHQPSQLFGFSTHGLGGNTIAQLSKGGSSGKYEESIAFVTASWNAKTTLGLTSAVPAIHTIQGEADQTFDTPFTTYVSAVASLHNDWTTDIQAITGQTGTIPLIMSQIATWLHYGNAANIGLAQLEAARTQTDVYLVGGQYQLEYYTDGLHLTPAGYYHLGELHARADIAISDGLGWAPFAPTNTIVTGTSIDVRFHVPAEPLVFDTTIVAAQPNMGFSLSGTTAIITGVAITAADVVTITTNIPVTEPTATIGYGVTTGVGGAGAGNLRDSDPSVSVYDSVALPNWALQFNDSLGIPLISINSTAQKISHLYQLGNSGELYELGLETKNNHTSPT